MSNYGNMGFQKAGSALGDIFSGNARTGNPVLAMNEAERTAILRGKARAQRIKEVAQGDIYQELVNNGVPSSRAHLLTTEFILHDSVAAETAQGIAAKEASRARLSTGTPTPSQINNWNAIWGGHSLQTQAELNAKERRLNAQIANISARTKSALASAFERTAIGNKNARRATKHWATADTLKLFQLPGGTTMKGGSFVTTKRHIDKKRLFEYAKWLGNRPQSLETIREWYGLKKGSGSRGAPPAGTTGGGLGTSPYPDGTKVRGPKGKTYIIKNGIPVIYGG